MASASVLDNYQVRCCIRARGGLALWSVRDQNGSPRVILRPTQEGDSTTARRMRAIAEAHRAIESPHVPAVIAMNESGSQPFLVFDSASVCDGETVMASLVEAGASVSYAVAATYNLLLMDAVETAHRSTAGGFGGALAWSNTLVDPMGGIEFVGFGDNFPVRDSAARPLASPGRSEAPELSLGLPVSHASDVYVVYSLVWNLAPHIDMPEAMTAAVQGGRPELRRELMALATDVLAIDPERRPQSVSRLRQRHAEVRRLASDLPDPNRAALREFFRARVASFCNGNGSGPFIRIDLSRRTAQIGSTLLELGRRRAQWALLRLLSEHQIVAPGRALAMERLLEAGWPGERPRHEAARARVYVAISQLRGSGLGDLLRSEDDGYLIARDVSVYIDRG